MTIYSPEISEINARLAVRFPGHGTGIECKRCGRCCQEAVCELGLALVGGGLPCKALEMEDGRASCGLILHMSQYTNLGVNVAWKDAFFGEMFGQWLGIREGCDAEVDT